MKPSLLLAALGSTACLLTAAPALAETYTTTYYAVIEGGADAGDLFGGGDLTGDLMSIAVSYDPFVAGTRTLDPVAGTDEIMGGTNFGLPEVISSTDITVLSSGIAYDYSYTPDYYNDVYTSNGYLDAYAYSLTDDLQVNFVPDSLGPTNLETSFSGSGDGDVTGLENFLIAGSDTIAFDPIYVTAGVAAAPEPTTWALMVSGLAVIGAGLRWSRRSRVALAQPYTA